MKRPATEPQKGPLYDVKVDNANTTAGLVLKAQDKVSRFKGSLPQIARMRSGALLLDTALRMGMASTISDIRKQLRHVDQKVASEAAAMKQQDVRTMPVLRDADLAARRAAKVQDGTPAEEKKDEQPPEPKA